MSLKRLCAASGGEMRFGVRISHRHASNTHSGVPVLIPDAIGEGALQGTFQRRVLPEYLNAYTGSVLRLGDVVCCQRGERTYHLRISEQHGNLILGRDCVVVRMPNGPVDPLYLHYYLSHANVRQWIEENAVSGSIPRIKLSRFGDLPVLYPDQEQQAGICGLPVALDQKIAINSALNETLRFGARTMLLAMLGGLGPDEIATRMKTGDGVNGMPIRTIGDVCIRVENGRTPQTDTPSYWSPPSISWINAADCRRDIILSARHRISHEGMRRSSMKLWPRGTTIIAMFGETANKVAWLGMPACGNQACCALIAPPEMQRFLYFYMMNEVTTLSKLAIGSSGKRLNQQIIANFPIVMPSRDRLKRFDEFVKPLIDKIERNLREIELLRCVREDVLCKLLPNGIPSREPAAGLAKNNSPLRKVVNDLQVIGIHEDNLMQAAKS